MDDFLNLESITDLHKLMGDEKPHHPLITIIDYEKLNMQEVPINIKIVMDFYMISAKTPSPNGLIYGRQYYDFGEGTLMFLAPHQVLTLTEMITKGSSGWGIFFHPDLIKNSILSDKIKEYTFFTYSVFEALHISLNEKDILNSIINSIYDEIKRNIDTHTKNVLCSSLDLLLSYCQRFYSRQFITRKQQNSDILIKLENELESYYQENCQVKKGTPTVEYLSKKLNLTSNYLTDLLKTETGKSTLDYIHLFVMDKAKNKLLNSKLSVNEIAYSLGFDYPQYFSRLFKNKVGMTPLEFRQVG